MYDMIDRKKNSMPANYHEKLHNYKAYNGNKIICVKFCHIWLVMYKKNYPSNFARVA